MPLLKIKQPGEIGVIEDTPDTEIAINAWSSVTNVRFNDGYAQKSFGYSSFTTPSVPPYFLLPLQGTSVFYWIYCGLTSIYTTNGNVHNNATNTSRTYKTKNDKNWDGDLFGGIPILNNGIDPPQTLFPVSPSNTFTDLINWPSGYSCGFIKSFGSYLVYGNVDKGASQNPYLVGWSHQADPGTLPATYDITDTTKDAGEQNLASSGGFVVDGGELGDKFIIYRENATHTMRLVGGRFIFGFIKNFGDSGIFARRCFVEFNRKHCVLTDDDLIIHDGRSKESILDGKSRNALFAELKSATNPTRAYLTNNPKTSEIWVCYPTGSANFATKALIWNYKHNTIGYITLPGSNDIKFDVVQPGIASTWDAATGTFDSQVGQWNDRIYNPSKRDALLADTTNTELLKLDDTNQFNGVSFTSVMQRTGVVIDGNVTSMKKINEIFCKIFGVSGTIINVKVGYQSSPGGVVSWSSAKPYTIGVDHKVSFSNDNNSGRFLAWRFESAGDVEWKLSSFDIDYKIVGSS